MINLPGMTTNSTSICAEGHPFSNESCVAEMPNEGLIEKLMVPRLLPCFLENRLILVPGHHRFGLANAINIGFIYQS